MKKTEPEKGIERDQAENWEEKEAGFSRDFFGIQIPSSGWRSPNQSISFDRRTKENMSNSTERR